MIKDKTSFSIITECTDNTIMYGIETRSGGMQFSYTSLTSNRDKIEDFINTLNHNDFPIDILPELIDDFLEELYGG